MAKKIVRTVSLALAAILSVSLSACSSGSGASSAGAASSAAAASTAASAAASSSRTKDPYGKYDTKVTLTTARYLNSNVKFNASEPTQKSLTENIWATTYLEKLNVEFDYKFTPTTEDYDTKWNAAIASKDIPDCAVVDGTIYKELVDAGMVEDMTQIYQDYASDQYKKCLTDSNNLEIKYMTFDGKLLGLPTTGATADGVPLLFIRRDWLKKVNMTEPKTMDDLFKVAQAFVSAKLGGDTTDGIYFCSKISDNGNLTGFFNSFGAYYQMWVKDSSGKLVYSTTQQDKWEPALLQLQKMYQAGLIRQDFSVTASDTASQDVVAGKVGILYGGFATPLMYIGKNMAADSSADWEIVTPPSTGSAYVGQASATPNGYIFVKKGCAHPEAVVKVMNLGLKIKNEDPLTYKTTSAGVEVFKYMFNDDGTRYPYQNLNTHLAIVNALNTKDTSKLDATTKQDYNYVTAAMSGSGTTVDLQYNLVFGTAGTFSIINTLKNNKQILGDEYQALPTDTMNTSLKTINDTLDTAIYKVIMGDPVSTYESAVAAWKNGGGDTITKEVNDWYSTK